MSTKPNKYAEWPRDPETLSIPLKSHKAIVAALYVTAMVANDNMAVVMVKGYGDDWENFTSLTMEEYEDCLDELHSDKDFFSDYGSPQLWVTVPKGGAA